MSEKNWRQMDDLLAEMSRATDHVDETPAGTPAREYALEEALVVYDTALFRAMQLLGMTTKRQDQRFRRATSA